ncbi:MAG TPA: DUF115 domain-containing protein [Candidatus Omnitrophota bacterium]|nr:DUF115 domain-containing protein [Candidatus Omnitrophota bacterium]
MVLKTIEMDLQYQGIIAAPPIAQDQLYKQACSNDAITITSWRDIWLKQIKANLETYGDFKAKGIGQLAGKWAYKPGIAVGSGPSLKKNALLLKDRGDMLAVSCTHNFAFLEDIGVAPDFYLTLDAGPITISELTEGGKEKPEWYWERTKNHKLLAFIGTDPEFLKRWQGEIFFYNAPVPDQSYVEELEKIVTFNEYISTGGNALGSCVYAAKAILGANPIAFLGADFSFSYTSKFHSWDSQYDKMNKGVIWTLDVYGNKVHTWPSYHNFKLFMDYIAVRVPGQYYNCTEGGTLGAYLEGNIVQIRPMDFADFLKGYKLHEEFIGKCLNTDQRMLVY